MRTQTSYMLIGSFVIGGLALLTASLVAVSGARTRDVIWAETLFDESVSGLEVGAPVRFRGVTVGRVTQITVAGALYQQTQHTYVVVRFELWGPEGLPVDRLRETLPDRIDEGLRVRLAMTGVTGLAFLEADIVEDPAKYPPKPRDWMNDAERDRFLYVPSAPSEFGEVVNSVEKALDAVVRADLPQLALDIRDAVKQAQDQIAAAGLGELNAGAKQLLASLHVASREVVADVDQARATFDTTMAKFAASAAAFETRIADPRVDAIVADVGAAVRELDTLVTRTRNVLADTEAIVAGRAGKVAGILDNLERATAHLRTLAATAEQYPSWLLFGTQPQPGGRR